MSVIDLITVLGFGLACFMAGYSIGKDKGAKNSSCKTQT